MWLLSFTLQRMHTLLRPESAPIIRPFFQIPVGSPLYNLQMRPDCNCLRYFPIRQSARCWNEVTAN